MIRKLIYIFLFLFFVSAINAKESSKIYEKIDLFGEVLEKIKKEYVDDVDQS